MTARVSPTLSLQQRRHCMDLAHLLFSHPKRLTVAERLKVAKIRKPA